MDCIYKEFKNITGKKVQTDINSVLIGHSSVSSLSEVTANTLMGTLRSESCAIFLEDKQNGSDTIVMVAGTGYFKRLIGKAKYAPGEGFTGNIITKISIKSREELESIEINGKMVWLGKYDLEQWQGSQSQFRNCIAVPIRFEDRFLGVIKIENKEKEAGGRFSDEDERYLEVMASVLAIAIENVRHIEKRERDLRIIPAKAAHRIRNQITNYDGIELELLEQIKSSIVNKNNLHKIAERIIETTSSIKNMVDEFDGFTKPLIINKTPCSINDIIDNEVWLAKPPNNIKIEKSLDRRIPTINLDAGRFAEVIKELLRNSLKAVSRNLSPENTGLISISSKLLDANLFNEKIKKSNFLIIEIRDNGPGFPQNFPVFEPFQSTDPRSTGLGLVIAKDVVEAHSGQIQALFSPEGGIYLRISIPFSD